MKNVFLATASAVLLASQAMAGSVPTSVTTTTEVFDPTFFAGFSWSLGGNDPSSVNVGFSLKVLTTNEPETLAGALGVTYFLDGTFGCDLGGAINDGGASLALTYDFCKNTPLIAIGAIKRPDTVTTTSSIFD